MSHKPIEPVVSVLIPVYNCAEFVSTAIASALGQTFGQIEVIVLDNASTDETADRVAQFSDPRLRYVRHTSNIGMVKNWNQGLSLAQGQYFVILCCDDYWHPEFLARAIKNAEPRTMIFTNNFIVSGGSEEVYAGPFHGFTKISLLRIARLMHGIPLSSLLIPRPPGAIQFDTNLPFNCDLELVLRLMIEQHYRLKFIDENLVFVRIHDNNETKKYNVRYENLKLMSIVKKYSPYFWLNMLFRLKWLKEKSFSSVRNKP